MIKNVLVLCTGNSCRSQMAHGFLAQMLPEVSVYSAGVATHGLNKLAVRVMAEADIDISGHTSNHVDEYGGVDFDVIITVCDHARESCPVFLSKALQFHQNFHDPSKIPGDPEDVIDEYRRTRDDIKAYLAGLKTSGIFSAIMN